MHANQPLVTRKTALDIPVYDDIPALQYNIHDVMLVLVNMQKEAQRREESFQRSLMLLEKRLKSQASYLRLVILKPIWFSIHSFFAVSLAKFMLYWNEGCSHKQLRLNPLLLPGNGSVLGLTR